MEIFFKSLDVANRYCQWLVCCCLRKMPMKLMDVMQLYGPTMRKFPFSMDCRAGAFVAAGQFEIVPSARVPTKLLGGLRFEGT